MAEDVLKLQKELVRASEAQDEVLAKDLIAQLHSLPISKELLQASGLGKDLGKLSKAAWSSGVAEAATQLVNALRARLKSNVSTPKVAESPLSSVSSSASKASSSVGGGADLKPQRQMSRAISEPEIVKNITGVRRRDVIIAKLAGAMQQVVLEDEANELGLSMEAVENKAQEIEEVLERMYGKDQHQHKTKFLQLLRNLRDPNNGQLRLRVAVGHLSAEELVQLDHTDLVSEDVKREIKDLQAYNKEASKARKAAGEITERFGACAKCKSPKTSYFMMQTRSADEPMTIFITCVVCGHAWRK